MNYDLGNAHFRAYLHDDINEDTQWDEQLEKYLRKKRLHSSVKDVYLNTKNEAYC